MKILKPPHRLLLLIAAVSLVTYSTASAQDTKYFTDVTETHVPQDAFAHLLDAEFGDVDNDGDLDVVAALEFSANRLYLNEGGGKLTWKKGVFQEKKHDNEEVKLADFDNDGNLDAIFVAEEGGNHEFYLGNGDGTFRDVTDRLPARSIANDVFVADINGDKLLDVIVANTGNPRPAGSEKQPEWESIQQNFLWLGDGTGKLKNVTSANLPTIDDSTQDIEAADLDGDGDLDLVVGNEVPTNRLLINDGSGKFTDQPKRLELKEPLETREVVLFDADGDGDKDVLFANLTSNNGAWKKNPQARLLINDGSGNFNDETELRMPANKFSSYDAGVVDFDRDGDLDILLCAIDIPGFRPLRVHAYRNDGKGNFRDVTKDVIPSATTGLTWDIEVGDLNGDGIQDVFVGGWGTQARLLLGKTD
ncbi:FG-GAP repeat domain-containing protein [Crateriforma spongiae]|uniref:FG-GAP repeat domain-containing protein n=1 Tax=Crateriforma spongiae TaxID=2724528 RepID=UPI0014487C37|nr:VCBS repeat-containing protein [Crateriforma spongiae]